MTEFAENFVNTIKELIGKEIEYEIRRSRTETTTLDDFTLRVSYKYELVLFMERRRPGKFYRAIYNIPELYKKLCVSDKYMIHIIATLRNEAIIDDERFQQIYNIITKEIYND